MNTVTAMTSATEGGKVLYTARVHTTADRDGGVSYSDDRRLDISHSIPGTPGTGTNPGQLLAAAWSACFEGAMGLTARKMKLAIPAGMAIDAEVDLVLTGDAYSIQARLDVSLPGLARNVARSLADAAYQTCPFSKALRGNIPIVVNVV